MYTHKTKTTEQILSNFRLFIEKCFLLFSHSKWGYARIVTAKCRSCHIQTHTRGKHCWSSYCIIFKLNFISNIYFKEYVQHENVQANRIGFFRLVVKVRCENFFSVQLIIYAYTLLKTQSCKVLIKENLQTLEEATIETP